ncbi:MAG: hypothetical protein GX640_07745, partial [Fibrobacter sp.]|nr:hypothetical protein [Fibrobacter sp.]
LPSLGFGQILLGALIIVISIVTAWLSIVILGVILAIWGGVDIFFSLYVKRGDKSSWRRVIPGSLTVAIGILLIIFPGIGVAALSLILAVLFILGGLHKILNAAGGKSENWGLEMSGGGISVLLGLFVFSQWPVNNVILLGILLGIEIILNGWDLMLTGYALRNVHYNKKQQLKRQ